MKKSVITCCVFALALFGASSGQSQALRTDIPSLIELDRLDAEGSRIERFALTARGAIAREIEIPGSQQMFCTLGQAHNVVLNYYPSRDAWVFQVQSNESAQYAAGGIAMCLSLSSMEAAQ